jgi:hypothetical protein
MYEVDGKMDSLVVLRASCVSRFSEGTAGAGEGCGWGGWGASHCWRILCRNSWLSVAVDWALTQAHFIVWEISLVAIIAL